MPTLKTTVIVSVYKDIDALVFILESLQQQTYPPSEIIISEDGDSAEMATFVAQQQKTHPNMVHLTQPDVGWRKNAALNNAIRAATGEYLIFIDGDCVPYHSFVHGHVVNAQQGIVLCGKRFELGEQFSNKIKRRELKGIQIERHFLFYLPAMLLDHARHAEDGFYTLPYSFLSRLLQKRYVRHIIGCNFSCFKADMLKINGFDETYQLPAEGEDVDPSWRFRGVGIELKSCRYNANIMHLYHKKRFSAVEGDVNKAIMEQRQAAQAFFCVNGIKK